MSTSNKKITLTSSDGANFEIEEAVALEFGIVANMIEDDCVNEAIPLANVTGKILGLAIEYCKTHVEAGASEDKEEAAEKLKKWDEDFVADCDNEMLFELILAANYLNCKGLLEITCQRVADNIKNKTVEEVRTLFNIENDFTEEEEAEVRNDNEWAFAD
ncbi:unnamed protein product [Eruca vesicaria subsp. sativa]|uniref:SKP1-like protein n=1 Tax=Eruca vesicaria subsp. sativa TaxID=29727 RepID=A0ABC8LW63_ERUVS|nr:unnamed protein product [Eruca vesicaria subsp. sativa]